jgi:hypothetical protein
MRYKQILYNILKICSKFDIQIRKVLSNISKMQIQIFSVFVASLITFLYEVRDIHAQI